MPGNDSTKSSFHPAYSVSNIKNYVPITLEIENVHYASWAELFLNAARAFDVLAHIAPAKDAVLKKDANWDRLDAIVKQWIYSTISIDLLHTILEPGATAQQAWDRLKDIFNDNQNSRAVTLEQQFSSIHMDNYPNVSTYCQALKMIADQLANVGSEVPETRLVLQLMTHLSEGYDGVATIIQQSDHLPSFYKARSMLTMEEARKAKTAIASDSALIASSVSKPKFPHNNGGSHSSNNHTSTNNYNSNHNNINYSKGRGGRNNKGNYRGKNSGSHTSNKQSGRSQPQQGPSDTNWAWVPLAPWPSQSQQGWSGPPCPYPTSGWAPPATNTSQGVLGPRPPHAFLAQSNALGLPGAFVPTDLATVMQSLNVQQPDDNYYMDTGASSHMNSNNGNLVSYSYLTGNRAIVVGNGATMPIRGIGNTVLPSPNKTLHLKNVLHVPQLIKNLVSVRKFTIDNCVSVEFDPFGFSVKDLKTGMPLLRSNSTGDLYPLLPPTQAAPTVATPHALTTTSSDIWHGRLGHPGPRIFKSLCTNPDISCRVRKTLSLCSSCQLGKQAKLSFNESISHTLSPFDILHTDLWTSPVTSTNGHRYYVLCLDDFKNFLWTFPITQKSQVYDIFTTFYKMIQTQFNYQIKTLKCDNGKEFDNTPLHKFFNAQGILFRFSFPHTSQQNGKAERKIRTLNNIVRTLLIHAHLPPNLWHHALAMATYLHNILPSKANHNTPPTSSLYHRAPSYCHLRTFGCICYPHTPPTTIHKLAPRATPCVFLGYPSSHRGYKCLDLVTKKIIIARHVTFDEAVFPFASQTPVTPASYDFLTCDPSPYMHTHIHTQNPETTSPPPPTNSHAQSPAPTTASPPDASLGPIPETSSSSSNHVAATPPPPSLSPQMTTRAHHGIYKPKTLFDLCTTTLAPIPKSPITALQDPNWHRAMKDEYDALIKNNTWVLVPRPPDVNVTRCLWLFKHKFKANSDLERYKARLVVNGRSQQVGVDCDETFSPVVKPAKIRTVLSLVVSKNWSLHQLDVKNAFLHGHLAETVYMHQPPGFRDRSRPDHVCLLKKSLYGLKQAPRAWYQRFANYVSSIGFIHSKCDNSLFVYSDGTHLAYLLLYVDDIILATSSNALRVHLISLLRSEFAMTDLGPLNFFLGIAVVRHKHGLFLHQHKYAQEIIARAKMSSCKPSLTPADTKSKLSASGGKPMSDPPLYRSLAGALQYLTFTRPDIAYVVQQICIFMHDPRDAHFGALKRIIRYLQGTSHYGLHITKSTSDSLTAYSDADWGGCPDSRRSTSSVRTYCLGHPNDKPRSPGLVRRPSTEA
ncbi:hypothetical protein vseg_003715 [Gypsophila vaccaria]